MNRDIIETFILKGFQVKKDGIALDWQTNKGYEEFEIARREFHEFPTDEDIAEFMEEFHPTRCEIAKCYR